MCFSCLFKLYNLIIRTGLEAKQVLFYTMQLAVALDYLHGPHNQPILIIASLLLHLCMPRSWPARFQYPSHTFRSGNPSSRFKTRQRFASTNRIYQANRFVPPFFFCFSTSQVYPRHMVKYIADMGICGHLKNGVCLDGSGTVGYMCPQRHTGDGAHGTPSDWFSLGVMLHQLLCKVISPTLTLTFT
jgi:serine/threonine protein kinase